MKTNGAIISVALILVINGALFGQDYTFKVLVNKGKNEVKTGTTWQPIKTGAVLNSTDELKLVDNSYVGLVHASGKPLELKQAGNYKVIELSAKVSGAGASVLNKYTDFILSSNTEKKNRLAATGAVHRGGATTHIFLPRAEGAVIFGEKLILDWEKEQTATPVNYVVVLKSMFGDDLFKTTTTDNTVSIDLADAKFANEDNIIIEIYPEGQESKAPDPPFMVKKLSTADKDRIKLQLNEFAGTTDQESALNKLLLAGFYEQNKLLIDATAAYLEAIELAPDVEEFKEDYNNFLLRNGIKEEPQK
jgi:hypothetical protein